MRIFQNNRKREKSIEELDLITNRQCKLMELASQDRSYRLWLGIFEEAKRDFDTYLEQQPPEVQTILCAALGTCQLLNQQLIQVACTNMDFIDPKHKK